MPSANDSDEFQRQVDSYVALGYPAMADLTEAAFRDLLEPLRHSAQGLGARDDATGFAIVITRDLIDPAARVPALRLLGSSLPGIVDRNHRPGDLATYHPLDSFVVPPGSAYLLVDIERGEEFRSVAPEDALPVIEARARTPLTIDEGISLVALHPGTLEKNKCFMLAGSRRNDRRVPALWISQRAPKLGWCWAGNPHSWLGVASAGWRVGLRDGPQPAQTM